MHDKDIGHYFILELGEDMENEEWLKHIDILIDFWSSLFIDDTCYKGDPYGPHFTIIGLTRDDFESWVSLFSQTADEVYIPTIANRFKEKGVSYSKDFMHRLFSDHKSQDLGQLKSKIGWE